MNFEGAPNPIQSSGEQKKIEHPEEQAHNDGTEKEYVLYQLLNRIPSEEEKSSIQELIASTNFLFCAEPYSLSWQEFEEEHQEGIALIQEKLKSGTLIDLGGGHGYMGQILRSEDVKMKNYINVDIDHLQRFKKPRPGLEFNKKTSQGFIFREFGVADFRQTEVSADMLDFLQYIEDNSINGISMNGIDDLIIDNPKYHSELANQVKRVLKSNGILFGSSSKVIDILGKNEDFQKKWQYSYSKILEKHN